MRKTFMQEIKYGPSNGRITDQSNKSAIEPFYHKINLPVKGILNQNKLI